MTRMRVVLADDHLLIRAGLRKLLEGMLACEVVGEADDGLAVLDLVEQLQPDLVLMDIAMPRLNGLEATRRLHEAWPGTRVLILSMHQNEEYVRRALQHGAVGYLLKDAAPVELEAALAAVARGDTYLSPSVSRGILNDRATGLGLRAHGSAPVRLTPRQREVLQWIAKGLSTKDIARQLGIAVKTVDTHRTMLMNQLDIHDVAGLVRYALRAGLISPDD